ncbi:MAG: response regulator [Elusimicrobia bacterium]|nr:MAG: response regulator [Elusimicrobiota bacterium]
MVDDEENVLSAMRRVLRREGYRILSAGSGGEGLAALRSTPVDVIVSDQLMPDMSGVEFLRQAKENWPETVRIVLSGYTELQSITQAINEGAIYKFLTKPWDDDLIRANIAEAFRYKALADDHRRLTRELATANRELQGLLAEKQHRLELDEASLEIAREVLYCLPLPLIGIDPDQQVVFANTAASTLLADGLPLCGEYAAECLPGEWLVLLRDDPPDYLVWQAGDGARRVLHRTLGEPSRPRGRLLVVMPAEADEAMRPKRGQG